MIQDEIVMLCGGYFLKQMYQAQSLWYAGKLSWSGAG